MLRRLGLPATGLVLGLLLLIPHPLGAQSSDYSYARVVRLSYVAGDVQIFRPEEEGLQPALLNMPIRQGYSISTGMGRAEIEFESGATARIAENSQLDFKELALASGARLTRMFLRSGTATFYAHLSREDVFSVETPHLVARVTNNDRFRVDVSALGSTVKALKGDIDVESSDGTLRVARGQTLFYRTTDADRITLTRSGDPDDWDRWVANRDEVVATSRSYSSQYVSSAYQYGIADLSYYGSWINVPGYGYGWRPAGVSFGWCPFFDGRWIYVNGVGLTWLSYEPWGWLPYHFGNWVYSPFGWVWFRGPIVGWHPGIVNWVNFGGTIGWCPRGPHDRPGRLPINAGVGTVINTSVGIMTGQPHARPDIRHQFSGKPLWSHDSPLRGEDFAAARAGRRFESGDGMARPGVAAEFSGKTGASQSVRPKFEAAGTEDRPAGGRPQRMPTGNTGIVFDAREGRYVNSAPATHRGESEEKADAEHPARVPAWGSRNSLDSSAPGRKPTNAEAPGAVFDPQSRRYVNNPDAPTRVEHQPEADRAPRSSESGGRQAGYSGRGNDTPSRSSDSSAPRTYSPPPRPADSAPRSAPDHGGWSSSPRGADSPRTSAPSHDSGARMSAPPPAHASSSNTSSTSRAKP